MFTYSDTLKTRFLKSFNFNNIMKEMMSFKTDDHSILNLKGFIEVNSKIKELSNNMPEKSKLFFHVVLATDL